MERLESIVGEDVNIPETLRAEDVIGERRALAQDVFSALVVRQRRVKSTL
jgi:hypothetical protein